MEISEQKRAELIQLIKDRVANYPDIEQLVASGKLKRKRGWYQVVDLSIFDQIKHYANEFLNANDGTFHVKFEKPSKRLRKLAQDL